jgi:hypothetical protein
MSPTQALGSRFTAGHSPLAKNAWNFSIAAKFTKPIRGAFEAAFRLDED